MAVLMHSNGLAFDPGKIQFAAPLHHLPEPGLQWIEISSSLQLPGFQIVGLPGREVSEARERVRAAIEASGFEFPRRRVVLNLSPANIRKQGTGLDLSMALAILFEERNDPDDITITPATRGAAWAELGLDGKLKPSGQVLRTLVAAQRAGLSFVLFGPEAPAHLADCQLLAARTAPNLKMPVIARFETLNEAYLWLDHQKFLNASPNAEIQSSGHRPPSEFDSRDLLLLATRLERILGAAAAGGHHLLLLGARGTGKSHALEWLQAIQPPLDPHSRLGQRLLEELTPGSSSSFASEHPPVRRIGQQIRPAALIGRADSGGIRPGEFSLAHGGLLLADEFLEWDRDAREAFREPLERGVISLTRAWAQVELPARFGFAATGNLCPCGGWPPKLHSQIRLEHPELQSRLPPCVCHPRERMDYAARLSGPILDRIDVVVRTPPLLPDSVSPSGAAKAALGSPKLKPAERARQRLDFLRERTHQVRESMIRHQGERTGILSGESLETWIDSRPDLADSKVLKNAQSLRSRHRILRVALALSFWDDPSGATPPTPLHLLEASSYRAESLGLGST
jgi:magnesium chelatase family protein